MPTPPRPPPRPDRQRSSDGGPAAPGEEENTDHGAPPLPRVTPQGSSSRELLGQMLLKEGLINETKLEQALSMARRNGERLGKVLVKSGYVQPESISRAVAKQFKVPFLESKDLSIRSVDRIAVEKVGVDLLKQSRVLPLVHDGRPFLVLADPLDAPSTDKIEAIIGRRDYIIATQSSIEMVLQVLAFETVDSEQIIESARDSIEEGQVRSLLEYILAKAVLDKASDVHIEPTAGTTVVRYRVDGELRIAVSLPGTRHENLANVIFSMAGVNLSDFNRLHDGRFSFEFSGRSLDIRFASSPTVQGPMMVMRILDDTRSLATMESLGYTSWNLAAITHLLRFPFGLILVVGPTGSGKTTTLYSCLSRINDGSTKILTVEDPVEIHLPSIQQIQVNEKAGVTFANSIRAFLRQDPDVILVGEIRDEETAREAFRAANTGHLVFSTLHANSAVEAVGRLLDLGMDPYQVATTLLGTLSQRLLRRICLHCSKTKSLDLANVIPSHAENLFGAGRVPNKIFDIREVGPGCKMCNGGHAGRTVVAEVLSLEQDMRELIHQRASNERVLQAARTHSFRSMIDNALWLVLKGQVSLEEAEATVGPLTIGMGKRSGGKAGREEYA